MTISRHPGPVCRSSPVCFTGEPDLRLRLSLLARARGFTREPERRARPPFTRPWPLFLKRVCRAYSRPAVAYRLLQLHYDARATLARALWSSQGRRPWPPSFSWTDNDAPLREQWSAASRAPSDSVSPGVGSSCLRRFARPRYFRIRPTTALAPGV